jgi:hypothetical protein
MNNASNRHRAFDATYEQEDAAASFIPPRIRQYILNEAMLPYSFLDIKQWLETYSPEQVMRLIHLNDRQVIEIEYGYDHPSLRKGILS